MQVCPILDSNAVVDTKLSNWAPAKRPILIGRFRGRPDGTGSPHSASVMRVKEWTEAQFFATIREGIDPSGNILDPNKMPWLVYRNGSDDDIRAIFDYMKVLPFGR